MTDIDTLKRAAELLRKRDVFGGDYDPDAVATALESLAERMGQEPDNWAILTPNGSKLVSLDEARGAKAAYPLYAAHAIRAAMEADK